MKKNKVIIIILSIVLSISLGFNIYIVIPKHKHIWNKWETVSCTITRGFLFATPVEIDATIQTKQCLECGYRRYWE